MALPKLYDRIIWHNDTEPALNEDNLNAMSKGLSDVDDRLIELAGTIMEDVPAIQHDLEILEPAIENIDANVTRAETAADNAEDSALKSEGYAIGEQDGVEVGPDSEYYQKNAKYYAEIANSPIENTVDFADIVTVTDAINKAAKDVRLKVEAVQDLHGYTKPWVGGAGKNLIGMSDDNTGTITRGNVTFKFESDGSVTLNGTSNINMWPCLFSATGATVETNQSWQGSSSSKALPNGSYKYTLWESGTKSSSNRPALAYYHNGEQRTINDTGSFGGDSVTIGIDSVFMFIASGDSFTNYNVKFQVEAGITSTSYEPYKNICPISGWDNAKVTRSGKNLYVGSPSFDGYAQASGWTKQDETYNGHDVYKRSGAWNGAYKIIYLPKGTYTFSAAVKTSDGGQIGIYSVMYGLTTTEATPTQRTHVASSTNWNKYSFTFTISKAGTVALRVEKESAGDIYISEYQLEVGSIATDYEPYQGEELTISLNGTRYGGTLDVTSGVLTIDKKYVDLGTLSYSMLTVTAGNLFRATISDIKQIASNSVNPNFICSNYPSIDADHRTGYVVTQTANSSTLDVIDSRYSDTTTFKAAMDGVGLVYELATPQTIQLTATEVYLLYGYNTLLGDCGDISLTYDASGIIHIEEAKLDTETLKTIAAASSDFADFKARIAAL